MTISTRGLVAAFGAAILTIGGVGIAKAEIVVPGALEDVEGPNNNAFPFNIDDPIFELFGLDIESMRYQQVYDASEFSTLSQPALITKILFRPDEIGDPFSSILPDIQINLSTTSAMPDALSTTFADNIGSDDTVVFGRGPLSLSSSDTGLIGEPSDFDIEIELETPFLYDPSAGNLLLDVKNFGGGRTTPFDAVNEVGDGTSRVFSSIVDGDVDSSSGTANSFGLITKFVFASPSNPSVPEPDSALSLLAVGCIAAAGKMLTRK